MSASCNTLSMSASSQRRGAAIYLRISLDQTGEGLAIERQRQECHRIVTERGWRVTKEYVDQSITASDARKRRPQYDALVRDFEAGLYDALVCYDLDRLTRQPRQLEDWIDAAEGRGLAIVTANGEADLTTDAGRLFARIKAAVARAEVERKSARQTAAARQRAALGRPPLGVRLTGYLPTGEVVEEEAVLVRRIFALFHGGESLRGITQTLAAEGASTRNGRPWNPSTIRGILSNPRYAGRAVYRGAETGELGHWKPLVSEDVFRVVNARLADPRRKTVRHGTDRKHLGSGIYTCGVCDGPIRAWSGERYRCRDGCVNRSMVPVDSFVLAVIAERLRRPDMANLLAAPPEDATSAMEAVTIAQHRLDAIAADYDGGLIDGTRFAVATAKAKAELKTVEDRLAQLAPNEALAAVLSAPDPAAAFLDASLMAQRAVIGTLTTVHLDRGTRYTRTFDPTTVRIGWRTGASS